MTNIDKIIKFDFRYIRERYFFMLVVIAITIACIGFFHLRYVLTIGLIVAFYQGSKISGQIYGEGLFRDGESMYKTFPIEPGDLIAAKVTLGWLVNISSVIGAILMALLFWGIPAVETEFLDFMYSTFGMLYRFGAFKCLAVFIGVIVYVFEFELLSMAICAARTEDKEDRFNKASILFTLAYLKSLVLIIVGIYVFDTHFEMLLKFAIADLMINAIVDVFVVRYTKKVIEGRR